MSYENMSNAHLIGLWNEASFDLRVGGNWMFHPAAWRTIAKVKKVLESRGFFDRPTCFHNAPSTRVEID